MESMGLKLFTKKHLEWSHIMIKRTPGQPLLPDPNGISWKSRPRRSMLLPSNLSGQNFSGSAQALGSLIIAHAFIITLDFFGMK
ncbi:hypothetical protein Lal_00006502 [Lupinus albus]|nr:hypothetical protein Lal_00006502 [Lupinus albus]